MGPKILAKVKADLNLEEVEQPAKSHWEQEVPELLKRSSWKAAQEE